MYNEMTNAWIQLPLRLLANLDTSHIIAVTSMYYR